MRSELFRIPIEWQGMPIFGVGVLLALWLVCWAITLWPAWKQHGMKGVAVPLPTLSLVALAIIFLPKLFPDGIPIRGYGVMLLIAAGSGVALACYRAEQIGITRETVVSMAFWLFICGIIGGRLFYVIEYWEKLAAGRNFIQTLGQVLNFPEGGLVIYGGLMGGMAAFAWFVYRHGLPFLATADIVAPSVMLGLALGRVGCLLNGCCYGGACELPWAVTFPAESPPYMDQVARGEMYGFRLVAGPQNQPVIGTVRAFSEAQKISLPSGSVVTRINELPTADFPAATRALVDVFVSNGPLVVELNSGATYTFGAVAPPPRSRPVHPTQIYSTINAGLIAWLLWTYYPFRRTDGEVLALMVTVYPVSRFLLEMIRTDESAIFGTGMSISQNISVLLLVGVVCAWVWLRTQPPRLTLAQPKA